MGYWRGRHRPEDASPPGLVTRLENCRVKDETSPFIQSFLLPREPQSLGMGHLGKPTGQPFKGILRTLKAAERGSMHTALMGDAPGAEASSGSQEER